jgi:hypothetical protein
MMSLHETPGPVTCRAAHSPSHHRDLTVVRLVEHLTRQLQRPFPGDRRKDVRMAFPQPVQLMPVARDGLRQIDVPLGGIGRSLGLRGLDFYHFSPIPSRYVLAVFEGLRDHAPLLLDVRWSHFLRQGWYLSGGRFLSVVSRPPLYLEDATPDVLT